MRRTVHIQIAMGMLLAAGAVHGQEARPPVRDQNVSGAPQRAQKAERADSSALSAEGLAALEKGNAAGAEAKLRQAVESNSEDITSRFYLALALGMQGKDAEALPHYEKLVEAQPEVYEIRVNYGQSLVSAGKPGDAVVHLEKALSLKPGETKTLYLLGYAELAAGDAEGARARFAAVLEAEPGNTDAQYGMGQAALKLGDRQAAEQAFRAAAADARYSESLLVAARAYEDAGELEKAAAIYREFPANAEAQKRAGELLIEAGNAKEAIETLQAAVKENPSASNRESLAAAFLKAGDGAKAAEQLAAILDAEPQNREIRMQLGRVLRDMRKFREAAAQFGAALKLDAQDAAAWSEFAGVAVLAGEYQAAFDAIGAIEKLGAMKPGHYYVRAIVLDRFQQDELALAQYEEFLSRSNGQNADEEFKARQRVRILKNKKNR